MLLRQQLFQQLQDAKDMFQDDTSESEHAFDDSRRITDGPFQTYHGAKTWKEGIPFNDVNSKG